MDELRPRIIGSEMEFTYRFKLPDGQVDEVGEHERRALYKGLPSGIARYRPASGTPGINHFLENGARYYTDINNILEYASPECQSPHELVNYEIAAEDYIVDHLSSDRVKEAMTDVHIFKRVSDHREHEITSGAHENYYSTILSIGGDFSVKGTAVYGLASHLITRSIFTGAGSTDHEGQFHKTQKLRNLKTEISTVTTGNKPIINTRDESLSANGSRIHVIAGDPNLSPWAAWMKYGTTSLVLRLIEHGRFPAGAELDHCSILSIAQAIGSTASLGTLVRTQSGMRITAINAQEALYEQAVKLGDYIRLPDEEYEVISQWEEVLNDLRTNPERCLDRIDWMQNQYVIEAAGSDVYKRHKRDLGYTMLHPRLGFGARLRDSSSFRMTPTQDKIINARVNPPHDTRAAVRGEAVRLFAEQKRGGSITWDNIAVFTRNSGKRDFRIKDPYDSNVARFHDWLNVT